MHLLTPLTQSFPNTFIHFQDALYPGQDGRGSRVYPGNTEKRHRVTGMPRTGHRVTHSFTLIGLI